MDTALDRLLRSRSQPEVRAGRAGLGLGLGRLPAKEKSLSERAVGAIHHDGVSAHPAAAARAPGNAVTLWKREGRGCSEGPDTVPHPRDDSVLEEFLAFGGAVIWGNAPLKLSLSGAFPCSCPLLNVSDFVQQHLIRQLTPREHQTIPSLLLKVQHGDSGLLMVIACPASVSAACVALRGGGRPVLS